MHIFPQIVQQSNNNIEIIAHEKDAPYIDSKKRLIKIDPIQSERLVIYIPGHTPGCT